MFDTGHMLFAAGLVITKQQEMVAASEQQRKTRGRRSYDVIASHLTAKGGQFFFNYRAGLDAAVAFYQTILHGLHPAPPGAVSRGKSQLEVEMFTLIRHPVNRLR